MEQHTPGPWHVHGGWGFMVRAGEHNIAECRQRLRRSELLANAQLIATAPEMLKVLQKFMDFKDSDYVPNGIFDQAAAVIKKAKGE